jgi:MoaA/NifB/PqqE/SkfB family radical SAM enzyme
MKKNSCITVQLDEMGHLILPPDLLAEYGIISGARVRLEESPIGFSISRSSHNLSRVYVEPTNMCNLDCATCMRNSWAELPGKMDEHTFQKIIAGIESISPRPSIFFGGFGEPLTHPRILDMLKDAKQVGSSVEIISNGILLTPEVSTRLIEMQLDRIWISLDGATPESYADVRLGNELPRVMENLHILKDLIKSSGSNTPRLGIAFVAMKRNIHDLPDVIRIGKKLGADLFSVSNVLPYTPQMKEEALYDLPIYGNSVATRWSPSLLLPRMQINEKNQQPLFEAIKQSGSIAIAREDLGMGVDTCPFVEKGSLSIRWDGSVSPCLALLHENENYLDYRKRKSIATSFGSVNEQQLIDIWNNSDYVEFRRRLLDFNFAYCTTCNGCYMADTNEEDCFSAPAPTCGGCMWAQGLIQCP